MQRMASRFTHNSPTPLPPKGGEVFYIISNVSIPIMSEYYFHFHTPYKGQGGRRFMGRIIGYFTLVSVTWFLSSSSNASGRSLPSKSILTMSVFLSLN